MTHETLQLNVVSPARLHVPPQVVPFIITTLLVFISVVLFMMDSTSNQVGTMLGTQNAASLKLWQNLKYNQQHGDGSLPAGLGVDVVEFSRTTENILKTAYRLTFKHILTRPELGENQRLCQTGRWTSE